MGKRWRIHPHDPDRIAQLERSAKVPAVLAQLLICRGIYDPDQAKKFLEEVDEDDPFAAEAQDLLRRLRAQH